MSGNIAVSLNDALDSLWKDGSTEEARARTIKLIKSILQKVVELPDDPKFRNINCVKLLPKLTSNGLGAMYVLKHAGFGKQGDRLLLDPNGQVYNIVAVLDAIAAKEIMNEGMDASGGGAASAGGAGGLFGHLSRERKDVPMTEEERKANMKKLQDEEIEFQKKKAVREAEKKKKEEEEAAKKAMEDAEKAAKKAIEDAEKAKAAEEAKTTEEVKTEEGNGMDETTDEPASEPASGAEVAEQKAASAFAVGDVVEGIYPPDGKLYPAAIAAISEDRKMITVNWGDGDPNHRDLAPSKVLKNGVKLSKLEGTNMTSAELDDEMKLIIKNLKDTDTGTVSAPKRPKVDTSNMTYEEKMKWLEEQKIANKKRREQEKFDKVRESAKNQKEIQKSAIALAEKREKVMMKQAYDKKKKEEKEARVARAKIKEKINADKARRKIEREKEQAELAKQKAAAAAGKN